MNLNTAADAANRNGDEISIYAYCDEGWFEFLRKIDTEILKDNLETSIHATTTIRDLLPSNQGVQQPHKV